MNSMQLPLVVLLVLCLDQSSGLLNLGGKMEFRVEGARSRDSSLGVFTEIGSKIRTASGEDAVAAEEGQQQPQPESKNPFSNGTPATQQIQGINPFAQTIDKSAAVKEPFVKAEAVPLPWTESVNSKRKLVYMDAMNAQLAMIESLGMECVSIDEKFVCRSSDVKPARIGNMEFRSERFRKVRLTYFDAGDNVQVFNALWMPAFEYDAPMLGTDLISLGKQRILSVIDMQPLHPDAEYSDKYITIPEVTNLRNKYPDLHGKLSGKIYDDTSFFSTNMLFGRFTDESKLQPVVHPAHEEYLEAYINKVTSLSIRDSDPAAMRIVEERQTAYDVYSALKDPAVGLFDAYFGKEWSVEFVHNFLFGLSEMPKINKEGKEGDVLKMQQSPDTSGSDPHQKNANAGGAPSGSGNIGNGNENPHKFNVQENGDVKFQRRDKAH